MLYNYVATLSKGAQKSVNDKVKGFGLGTPHDAYIGLVKLLLSNKYQIHFTSIPQRQEACAFSFFFKSQARARCLEPASQWRPNGRQYKIKSDIMSYTAYHDRLSLLFYRSLTLILYFLFFFSWLG